ncbi:MAG: universal stress protein UspA [Microbacteriaceae bacterium]|nr:universal stress protein UspA [Microbacteriaceae bacterium]
MDTSLETSTDATVSGRRVVVGVDGSPQSLLALRRAAEMFDDETVIEPIMVWQHPPTAHTYALSDWDPEEEAARVLRDAIIQVFGDPVPGRVRPAVTTGPAAKALIDASSGAELLIVGSRGHGGFAGLVLGSVSSACAGYAHCPVLVMREPSVARRTADTAA